MNPSMYSISECLYVYVVRIVVYIGTHVYAIDKLF